MTALLEKGRYRARETQVGADIARAQALRAHAFGCDDRDALDDICTHILVEDVKSGEVLCCFRMLLLQSADLDQSYAAQFYDLSALASFQGPMVEMGRFCTHREHGADADLLRIAWGAMTTFVDAHKVDVLFGCSSFAGTDQSAFSECFSLLKDSYIAPRDRRPLVKFADVIRFDDHLPKVSDRARALRSMPPLLRTYLMMGGWVSDHAVVDHKMNTMHVFTGVEIAKIPEGRKRLLRAIAG